MGTIDWFEHVRAEELSALEGALRNHFPRAGLRQDIDDVGDVHALDLDTQRPRSASCGFASRLQRVVGHLMRCMMPLKSQNELRLNVARQLSTTDDRRPNFKRRHIDQSTIERNGIKVVVEKRTTAAVPGIA